MPTCRSKNQRLAKATVENLTFENVKTKLKTIFGDSDSPSASDDVKFEELNIAGSLDWQEQQSVEPSDEAEETSIYYSNNEYSRNLSGAMPHNRGMRSNMGNRLLQQSNATAQYPPRQYTTNYNSNKQHSQNQVRAPSFRGQRWRRDTAQIVQGQVPQHNRRGGYTIPNRRVAPRKGRNPIDNMGQTSKCAICESINHWAADCPDSNPNTVLYEENEEYTYYTSMRDAEINSTEDVTLFETDLDDNTLNGLVAETLDAAVIDCGASRTCGGSAWWNIFKSNLSEEALRRVEYKTSKRIFKFGDGRQYPSLTAVKFPASIAGKHVSISADIVSANVPLLLSRESLKSAKTKINFSSDTAEILGEKVHLITTKSGHYALPITIPTHLFQQAISSNDYSSSKLHNAVHSTLSCSSITMDAHKLAEKLHQQFAHPPTGRLLKLVNSAGEPWCSNEALKEEIKSLQLNCKTCRLFKRPPPRPVAGLPLATHFLQCVANDLKFDGKHILLHMIDHATRLSVSV